MTEQPVAQTTQRDDREGHFIHCLLHLYDSVMAEDEGGKARALMLLQAQERSGGGAVVNGLRQRAKADYDTFWERANGR